MPDRFKTELFTSLATELAVPQCLGHHICLLADYDVDPDALVDLVEEGLARTPPQVGWLEDARPLGGWPEPDDEMWVELRRSALAWYHGDGDRERLQAALRRVLGRRRYDRLCLFLEYVRTYLDWAEAHPGIRWADDRLVCEQLPGLLERSPRLARLLDTYVERRATSRSPPAVVDARRADRWLAVHHAFARVVNAVRDPAEGYDSLLAEVGRALGWRLGELWTIHDDGDRLVRRALWSEPGLPDRDAEAFGADFEPRLGQGLAGLVWRSVSPLWSTDVCRDDRCVRCAKANRLGLHAALGLPIRNGQGCRGIVVFYAGRVEEPDDALLRMAELLGRELGAFLDMREQRMMAEEDRLELIEHLQEAVRLSELFVGILGHDLRNPLAAILGTASIVPRLSTDPEMLQTAADRILAASRRMNRMIAEILDFTRIRIGTGLAVAPTSTDLAELWREVAQEVELAHPDASIAIDAVGDTRGRWDADRLAQVFTNVAANAVEHGEGGAVHVEVDASDPDRIVVDVSNRGAIGAAEGEMLFDPFKRLEKRGRSGGLGLGLFIARHIVDGHGGSISMHPAADDRTVVRLELPRQARAS